MTSDYETIESERVMDRVMLTHLLTSDGHLPTGGRVVGVTGLHTRKGQFMVFPAKAVVLGTGPFTSDLNFNYIDNCTGEGAAATYEAGAELMEMEFGQHGTISYFAGKLKVIGQSKLQGQGTRIVNHLGERIMEQYDPKLKELTTLTADGSYTRRSNPRRPPAMDCLSAPSAGGRTTARIFLIATISTGCAG